MFQKGKYALEASSIPFTGIGVDQGQEFLNKVLKSEAFELARLALETEELIGFNPKSKRQHHHHHLLSAKFIERQNKEN